MKAKRINERSERREEGNDARRSGRKRPKKIIKKGNRETLREEKGVGVAVSFDGTEAREGDRSR